MQNAQSRANTTDKRQSPHQSQKPHPNGTKREPTARKPKLHEAWHGDQTKHTEGKETKTDRTNHTTEQDPIQTEADKRLAEMKAIRAKRATKQQQTSTKKQDRER